MSLARPHQAGALLVASLLLVLTAATGVHGACNATCKRDVARCVATQCAGVGRETCRRRCKPAAIRTLAYVVTECREDAAGMVVYHQALRIRRGDREPIPVVEFPPSEPVPDPGGLCRYYGDQRAGNNSVLWFPLQRLGVSPDGSGVVFEVNTEFSRVRPVSAEQQGMFFVRSDGGGLRSLGPASHAVSFHGVHPSPPIAFSPNGRRIAFTDLGKGPDGENAVQIAVLDLATGERTQVTHLPSNGGLHPDFSPVVTCCPKFVDDETVVFQTYADPDGSNPEHDLIDATVRIDGSRFTRLPTPVAGPGSHLVPSFEVGGRGTDLLRLELPGSPVKPYPGFNFPIVEVLVERGTNLTQLTNFHAADTFAGFLSAGRAFFLASADPVGENPYENCQMFSVNTLGRGLRQITHFNPGRPVDLPGCSAPGIGPPGCCIGNGYYRVIVEDPVTKAVVFNSSCDPFDANPFGDQLFAMRPDGSGLRQLTDAAGFTQNPDGSFRVELPGPFAYSAPLR